MTRWTFVFVIALFSPMPTVARPVPLEPTSARPNAPAPERLSLLGSGATPPSDLVTYFGGTFWNANSFRWEAIQDSVWTFDSGVGSSFQHPDTCKNPAFHFRMEGWEGVDRTLPPQTMRFRRLGESDFSGAPGTCVGASGGLGGMYSLWAGLLPDEADSACYAAGAGYGDNWDVSMVREFAYDGTDSLLLRYDYANDTEDSFDYTYVIVDTSCAGDGSGQVIVQTYTGTVAGSDSVILVQGVSLPSGPGCIRIEFNVRSDAVYSDEDGLFTTTCGAFAVDDILVQNIQFGGVLNDLSDFESGEQGWQEVRPVCGSSGDFSRLMDLTELDPPPPPPAGETCNLQDSVLVFFDPNTNGHGAFANAIAMSPWIDLQSAGLVGIGVRSIEHDIAADLPLQNFIFLQYWVQYYPDTCAVTGNIGVSPLKSHPSVFHFESFPVCKPTSVDFTGIIPPGTERLRIGIGVVNHCRFFYSCTGLTNTTPWIDNVRFKVGGITTLQASIDAAAPGDTVWVPGGVYDGGLNRNLNFGGKNLVLLGYEGPENTIIEITATNGRGFRFENGEDSTSVVCGFTIRGGNADFSTIHTMSEGGGAVYVANNSHPTFIDCIMTDNQADFGGAVFVDNTSSIRMVDCVLEDNVSGDNGGGAYLGSNSGLSAAASRVERCSFSGNMAGLSGGGLFSDWASVDACSLSQNSAFIAGGVWAQWGISGTTLTDCWVFGNTSTTSGGGIYATGARIRNCAVENNSAANGGGGVVLGMGGLPDQDVGAIMSGTRVTGNTAGTAGGGVLLDARAVVDSCDIRGNQAVTGGGMAGGGCTQLGSKPASGEPAIPDPCPPPPLIRKTVIAGNLGTFGGGVALRTWNGLRFESCTVAGNRANDGGGFYLPLTSGSIQRIELVQTIVYANCGTVAGDLVFFADLSGVLALTCSAVDTSGVSGPGTLELNGPQVLVDPFFCGPAACANAPTPAGDYTLGSLSPCLPSLNSCGLLIGALGEGCTTTGIPGDDVSAGISGLRAYPNPFTGNVRLDFSGSVPSEGGRLEIFDLHGRLVRSLGLGAGVSFVDWDGADALGVSAPRGVYFVRARSTGIVRTIRLVRVE